MDANNIKIDKDKGFSFEHQNQNLDKMLEYVNFSDSDSEDNNNNTFTLNPETYQQESNKVNNLYNANIEEEDGGTMNTYTGTKHEKMDIEMKEIPIPPELLPNDTFVCCGLILSLVEGRIIFTQKVLNLINNVINVDNIIYDDNKAAVGYVDDVFGQVEQPVYSAKIFPNLVEAGFGLKPGQKVFYCQRLVKFVNADDICKNKGCDASNQFDEEVDDDEKDFSDDEEEKKYKHQKG